MYAGDALVEDAPVEDASDEDALDGSVSQEENAAASLPGNRSSLEEAENASASSWNHVPCSGEKEQDSKDGLTIGWHVPVIDPSPR